MAGLLGAVRENSKHESSGVWLFELGRRYLPTPDLAAGTDLAQERRTLGIALHGPLRQNWLEEDREADFYDLKGVAEMLLDGLHVTQYRLVPSQSPYVSSRPLRVSGSGGRSPASPADSGVVAGITCTGSPWPFWERCILRWRTALTLPDARTCWKWTWRDSSTRYRSERIRRYHAYPAAERDLALVVGADVAADRISEEIRRSGGTLLRSVRLFDVYMGEGIPEGKKSVAFSLTYQSPDRTLTSREIEDAQAAILAALGEKLAPGFENECAAANTRILERCRRDRHCLAGISMPYCSRCRGEY